MRNIEICVGTAPRRGSLLSSLERELAEASGSKRSSLPSSIGRHWQHRKKSSAGSYRFVLIRLSDWADSKVLHSTAAP